MQQRLITGLAAMAIFIAAAPAQRIDVPDRNLIEGETITVTYSNPSTPGRFVHVEVWDGDRVAPGIDIVEIWLGPDGKGSRQYTIKRNWWAAFFNGPGAHEVVRAVEAPGQGGR
jgi:hypothetical protein